MNIKARSNEQVAEQPDDLFVRFQALRNYVGCQPEDSDFIRIAAPIILPHLDALIDDFYAQILQHKPTRERIVGGPEQVQRLKGTLCQWLRELLEGQFDADYVARRWQVGWRHVEIGLRQVYVNVAHSRLRGGILRAFHKDFAGPTEQRFAIEMALNRALDLDLAIIQDAYDAEKSVRSEAAFSSLVEAADCAIFILRPNQRVTYVNPFAEEITGYKLEEVKGRTFGELLAARSGNNGDAIDFEAVLQGQPMLGRPLEMVCRDGTQRKLVWNVRRLNEFGGGPAVLGVGHDITLLHEAQERALQSERLAAIGQTMAGLAHESRNAFQRIQACLEMLQLEVSDRADAMEFVERIQRALNHLHHLNEEVRSYAAPIRLDMQSCDLARVLREEWNNLEISRRDKSFELRELPGAADTVCDADHFAIGQVLRNVLENAIAACPEPGVIEVGIQQASVLDGRDALAVVVRDNGSGIAANVRRQIFEPFFTTKTKGTGLGMAIARRIVDAHGGEIVAGNHAGGGAEFVITLPKHRKPP